MDDDELPDAEYLRDLAVRLRRIPVMHGVDGYDIDRLYEMARKIDTLEHEVGLLGQTLERPE